MPQLTKKDPSTVLAWVTPNLRSVEPAPASPSRRPGGTAPAGIGRTRALGQGHSKLEFVLTGNSGRRQPVRQTRMPSPAQRPKAKRRTRGFHLPSPLSPGGLQLRPCPGFEPVTGMTGGSVRAVYPPPREGTITSVLEHMSVTNFRYLYTRPGATP